MKLAADQEERELLHAEEQEAADHLHHGYREVLVDCSVVSATMEN